MRYLFNKKGQAAVEYLVTYGWAFLAILATVGVMSYFGLLNPSKYIPDSCQFGNQLNCQDHYLDDNQNIVIRFQNNFEDDISITEIYEEGIAVNIPTPIDIDRGDIKRVDLLTTRELFSGTKESFELVIEFQRNDGTGTTPKHNVSGEVFGEVQIGNLGLIT